MADAVEVVTMPDIAARDSGGAASPMPSDSRLIGRVRSLADAWDAHYRGGRVRDAKEECAEQLRAVLDAHEERQHG